MIYTKTYEMCFLDPRLTHDYEPPENTRMKLTTLNTVDPVATHTKALTGSLISRLESPHLGFVDYPEKIMLKFYSYPLPNENAHCKAC